MDERSLIIKAKNLLTREGGFAWSGARWTDIFGIFDILYISPAGETSYYQVSTKDHRWSRLQKLEGFRKKQGALPARSFLMLWDYNLNDFEIEKI